LREGSDAEAETARRFASRCGYESKVLKWLHSSPTTAIQEKAREARYGLMGNQCRKDKIKYLLTAHSEDDQAETLLMRYERRTDWRGAAGMAEVIYGPVWPELAMVSIARPLLDISRKELRDYNRQHKLKWVEDPSNENRNYARIRARDYLGNQSSLRNCLLQTAKDIQDGLNQEKLLMQKEFADSRFGQAGEIYFQTPPSVELLGQAMRCVGGGSKPIDRKRLRILRTKLLRENHTAFTMLGAQTVRYGNNQWVISRDPVAVMGRKDGNMARAALPLQLSSEPKIWDGRFLISSDIEKYEIRGRYGLDLPRTRELDDYIRSFPKSVRHTAPIIVRYIQAYAPSEISGIQLISLVRKRLEAALGGPVS